MQGSRKKVGKKIGSQAAVVDGKGVKSVEEVVAEVGKKWISRVESSSGKGILRVERGFRGRRWARK